jgi:hypothetical protein
MMIRQGERSMFYESIERGISKELLFVAERAAFSSHRSKHLGEMMVEQEVSKMVRSQILDYPRTRAWLKLTSNPSTARLTIDFHISTTT